ncbi:MAG: hypothetical protein IH606_21105 [Burkholderiales bacterium]|nr:hypothetical protein [Burkholderiales bacterium]
MISVRKLVVAIAALALAVGLAGCGETEQVIMYKQGKYQGKPDTRPWDSAPGATTTSKWSKGDKGSWESALRSRSQNQNEYVRIGD